MAPMYSCGSRATCPGNRLAER